MGIRMHMAKEWKRTAPFYKQVDYDGTVYDYILSVKYYPKVYFSSFHQDDIEEWLRSYFLFNDIDFFIPEGEDT